MNPADGDAVFPKTPKHRPVKKNLDFALFSSITRPAKLNCAKLAVFGRSYNLWLSKPLLEKGTFRSWEFSTDSRRCWYVNIQVEMVSSKIFRDHAEIYVGDVSASKLAGTQMAKPIHDAGWAMLRNILSCESIATDGVMRIVSKRRTPHACSCCGSIPGSCPKAMDALGIRHWVCSGCGEAHDRDVNAALNILRVESRPAAVEMPGL